MTTNNTKSEKEADIRVEKQRKRILVVCIVENVYKQSNKNTDHEQYWQSSDKSFPYFI